MTLPRIHARIRTRLPATIDHATAPGELEVLNLSAGGALLAGAAIEIDAELGLDLHASGGEPIAVRAKVVRHDGSVEGRDVMAVEFQDVDATLDARLTEVVTRGFMNVGARVMGQVRQEMARRGITDVALVAEELQRIKQEQVRAHLFAADLFTERGSDAVAAIMSGTSDQRRECIVWSLNLYLGLNREPRVIEKTKAALERFGTGCGTSAPSGGLNLMHRQIERRVSRMVGKPRTILFPTGYSANLGALSALPGPKDLVILDKEAHASMIDGVKLSGKKWITFRHNDVADLEDKLTRFAPHHENVFVAVESAYSMSGDLAPLKGIAALKRAHKFYLYVDEAHTFGFYGEGGRGYCHEQGVTADVDFIMSTFSKATASTGGFLAAEEKFCTLLQATATPYIFQACLTPPDAATILASLDEIENTPSFAQALHANNRDMREQLEAVGFDLGTSQSPVIPVYVPDLEKLHRLCALLYMDGIFSVPVTYPAVSPNEGRIRFIANAHHTSAQIKRTVDVLAKHARALGLIPAR